MENILTAEEFVKNNITSSDKFDFNCKVELVKKFAKVHVIKALEAASKSTIIETTLVNTPNKKEFYKHFHKINKELILNAYNLDNIK